MFNLRKLIPALLLAMALTYLACPVAVHAEPPAGDQAKPMENAIVEAYGGKAELGRVKTVVAKGTITEFMKGKQGGYTRYFARPDRLRIEIMPEQGGETRILNADRGWRGYRGDLREAQQAALQAMAYQCSYLDLPMGFADGSRIVKYIGRQTLQGRQLDLLEMEVKGGPSLRIYVDPEKKLIVRVASRFDMGMGSSELVTEYENFRPVGKVLFPFRLVNYAGEMKLSEITLTDIRLNEAIPPELFAPPKSK